MYRLRFFGTKKFYKNFITHSKAEASLKAIEFIMQDNTIHCVDCSYVINDTMEDVLFSINAISWRKY